MRLACRLFIPLQLLLHRSPPRPSPRKEVATMGCVLAAKDAMTISLRALGRRYRRLGAPIFSSAELARRRERQVKRERNQRSTIKAARLVCLAKAFLRPAIDPMARIGTPMQHQHMKLALANYVYTIEEVTVILAEINAKNGGGISKTAWLFINVISRQRRDIQSSSDYLFVFALSFVIEWLSKMDDNEGCAEQASPPPPPLPSFAHPLRPQPPSSTAIGVRRSIYIATHAGLRVGGPSGKLGKKRVIENGERNVTLYLLLLLLILSLSASSSGSVCNFEETSY
ncbi:hypothetical protein G5I_09845 [Acromyrmex echinatior]|uniref:Uncharacterized protein n=1 Tax=Acromyrmex echinatior TaxID=103372 RepID=F4WV54_ACREC|nr:hypothetical protein G5I_09845 [Acromyrmex echinatior]